MPGLALNGRKPPSETRILVADDEAGVREFITRGLSSAGYQVTAAEDGEHALQRLAEATEQGFSYDLLITDIMMPQIDGISLALIATRDHREMKVIMISGYADARARAYNLEALIQQIMEKPFSLQELLSHVDTALNA